MSLPRINGVSKIATMLATKASVDITAVTPRLVMDMLTFSIKKRKSRYMPTSGLRFRLCI